MLKATVNSPPFSILDNTSDRSISLVSDEDSDHYLFVRGVSDYCSAEFSKFFDDEFPMYFFRLKYYTPEYTVASNYRVIDNGNVFFDYDEGPLDLDTERNHKRIHKLVNDILNQTDAWDTVPDDNKIKMYFANEVRKRSMHPMPGGGRHHCRSSNLKSRRVGKHSRKHHRHNKSKQSKQSRRSRRFHLY